MLDPHFCCLSNGLQRRILKEMSDPRRIVMSDIGSQRLAIMEHSAKIVIFGNSTNDLNDWASTLANIFNYINNMFVKGKTKKLKHKEYLEIAFGVDDTFDEDDAGSILDFFDLKFSNKFPKYDRTSKIERGMYLFYKVCPHTFLNIFLRARRRKTERVSSKKKIIKIWSSIS